LYLCLIILSIVGDVLVDNETLLMTNFVNLKIKPVQFFRCGHRVMLYVRIFIGMSTHTCVLVMMDTTRHDEDKRRFALINECNHVGVED
jgi:hypothetical protein